MPKKKELKIINSTEVWFFHYKNKQKVFGFSLKTKFYGTIIWFQHQQYYSLHLKNIYEDGYLDQSSTTEDFSVVHFINFDWAIFFGINYSPAYKNLIKNNLQEKIKSTNPARMPVTSDGQNDHG